MKLLKELIEDEKQNRVSTSESDIKVGTAYFIVRDNGELRMSTKGTPIHYSTEEQAKKFAGDEEVVELPTERNSYAYNGRIPKGWSKGKTISDLRGDE